MAGRQYKTGLDYLELDCYMDEKIKMIQAEYGLKGFAIVVKLYQVIYRGQGYYCEWHDENKLLFLHEECGDCGTQLLDNIVSACIRRNIFSRELFEKYRILTSNGIQKRYFNAVSRREKVKVKKEYLLVKVCKNAVDEDDNPINVDRNSINVNKNAQRKEKKRKEKNNTADADFLAIKEEDDEGMDPMEAMRLWNEKKGKEKQRN